MCIRDRTKTLPSVSSPTVTSAPSVATKATSSSTEELNHKNAKIKAKNESAKSEKQRKETPSKIRDLKTATTEAEESIPKVDKQTEESKESKEVPVSIRDTNNTNTLNENEASKINQLTQKKVNIRNHSKEGKTQLVKPSANDKLKDLKAKFTNSKTFVPPGIISHEKHDSNLRDGDSNSSGSSTEEESSSSSSSDEEISTSRKARRVVVNTPREPVRSSSSKIEAPSSLTTQRNNATPNKVPVTKLMDMSSPPAVESKTPSKPSSILHDLPRKVRPSLSSLSDLVSRGIPDVKEKTSKSSGKPQPKASLSSEDESSPDSESNSSSDSLLSLIHI